MMRAGRRLGIRAVVVLGLVLTLPVVARGQSGPLTGVLSMEEPTKFGFQFGPLRLSPQLTLPAFGYEANVFDEDVNPKKDWTITLGPDMRFFAQSGLLRAVAVMSTEFTYFQKYASERAIGRSVLSRAELTMARFQPWVAAAHVNTRNRANREISVRARRKETEVSTGINFTVTPIVGFYVMGARVDTRYGDEVFRNVDLGRVLNYRTESLSAGATFQATPFTTVVVGWALDEDTFAEVDDRNARSTHGTVLLEFGGEAMIRGSARVGFQDFRPADSRLTPFRGITSAGTISFQLMGTATVETTVLRQVQYSFEELLGYYVETGADVVYTHRIGGPYDFQVEASRRQLDYTRVTAALRPVVYSYQAGLGYNFRDSSRIGVNYEYSQRVDDQRPDRRFDRRRLFASYSHELQ